MKKAAFILSILFFIIGCQSSDKKTLSEKLTKGSEIFFINNKADTLIQGKEGTLVFIEKESFRNSLGEIVSDSIAITLQEVYKTEDIIAHSISMRSKGQLLETAGMINLQASANGNALTLKPGKEVIVHFPKKIDTDGMHLFYGQKDTTQIITWELEASSTYQLVDSIIPWYTKYTHPKVDNPQLTLGTGENWGTALPRIFNISEDEQEELLNKTVDLHYVIKSDGTLAFKYTAGSKISRKLRTRLEKVAKTFPSCKPYTRNGVPTNMEGFFKIFTKVRPPEYQGKENYLRQIEDKFQGESGTSSPLEIAELQYYIFDSRNLGWMNCDKFINVSSESINYVVKVPKSDNIFAKIVFTNYNTVMTGNEKRGRFIFENLPLEEPVKIVVLDEKRGKSLLKIVNTKITKAPIEIKNLGEYTLEELKEKLKEIK